MKSQDLALCPWVSKSLKPRAQIELFPYLNRLSILGHSYSVTAAENRLTQEEATEERNESSMYSRDGWGPLYAQNLT